MNPSLLLGLTAQRQDELRLTAARPGRDRARRGRGGTPGRFQRLRHAAGWALVEMGLRLAVTKATTPTAPDHGVRSGARQAA